MLAVRFFNSFWISLFIITIFFCCDSLAKISTPLFKSPNVYRFNAGFISLFGQGEMGNDNIESAPPRDLDFTTYQVFAGVRISNYRFSWTNEWTYGAQQTSVEEVNNTNLSGQNFCYGPRIDFYDGKQSIGLIYRLKSRYRLNKLDANNNRQYYSSRSGFNIQLTRRIQKNFGIVIDYAREEYGESLPNAVSWDRLSVGLIFTNFDKLPYPVGM